MKTNKLSILILLSCLALPVFSAEQATNSQASSPPATVQVESAKEVKTVTTQSASVSTTNYKDAFLALALEKAKSYSGTIENTISKAVDAVQVEAPLIVGEFLRWHLWKAGVSFGVNLFILSLVLVLFYKITKWWNETADSDAQFGLVVLFLISIIPLVITSINLFNYSLEFIQILVAPRIYLIEQVMVLVKK